MLGVRCVSDKDWATAAETAECAMAHLLVGDRATALDLFQATMPMRRPDGHYLTGIVYPGLVTFPASECSTYTAAAVILAADAIGTASVPSGSTAARIGVAIAALVLPVLWGLIVHLTFNWLARLRGQSRFEEPIVQDYQI